VRPSHPPWFSYSAHLLLKLNSPALGGMISIYPCMYSSVTFYCYLNFSYCWKTVNYAPKLTMPRRSLFYISKCLYVLLVCLVMICVMIKTFVKKKRSQRSRHLSCLMKTVTHRLPLMKLFSYWVLHPVSVSPASPGDVHRGGCQVLSSRAGVGSGPPPQPGHHLQGPQTRKVRADVLKAQKCKCTI